MARRRNAGDTRKIARERIKVLFEQAEREFDNHPGLSSRYVALARKIAMKSNMSMPRELKRKFCKGCGSYLKPGTNLKVRLHRNRIIYTCLKCGRITRFKKPKLPGSGSKKIEKNI